MFHPLKISNKYHPATLEVKIFIILGRNKDSYWTLCNVALIFNKI